jgi:NAD-dependent deacetylase
MKRKLVVLTGAGISAESGISTFRDSNGLWENHRIEDVATPDAWQKNPELVLEFYNQRRKQAQDVQPNRAHHILHELEADFEVQIITQNVDDLHERAGSRNVLHLHGILSKSRSTKNPELVFDIPGWELSLGDHCPLGSQLRPNIVWFGEAVPLIEEAIDLVSEADIFAIVGTSLAVYPAAGLKDYVSSSKPIYLIDPAPLNIKLKSNMTFIQEKASIGLQLLNQELKAPKFNSDDK